VQVSVRVRAALAVGWALAVLAASLQPSGDGGFALASPLGLVGPDKWLHAAGYALLAALVASAVLPRTRRRHFAVLVAVVAYGALVELLQIPVAGRSGDVFDALANAAGAGATLAAWWTLGLSARFGGPGGRDDGAELR
jgi:VanZ family protein